MTDHERAETLLALTMHERCGTRCEGRAQVRAEILDAFAAIRAEEAVQRDGLIQDIRTLLAALHDLALLPAGATFPDNDAAWGRAREAIRDAYRDLEAELRALPAAPAAGTKG